MSVYSFVDVDNDCDDGHDANNQWSRRQIIEEAEQNNNTCPATVDVEEVPTKGQNSFDSFFACTCGRRIASIETDFVHRDDLGNQFDTCTTTARGIDAD